MRRCAGARDGEIIIFTSAHQRDELLHGFGGHRRMHYQHLGRRRSDDDWLENLHRVVGNLGIEAGVYPQRRTSDSERLAIPPPARPATRPDIAPTAAAALYTHML